MISVCILEKKYQIVMVPPTIDSNIQASWLLVGTEYPHGPIAISFFL
jgi:hypothetical protein